MWSFRIGGLLGGIVIMVGGDEIGNFELLVFILFVNILLWE